MSPLFSGRGEGWKGRKREKGNEEWVEGVEARVEEWRVENGG